MAHVLASWAWLPGSGWPDLCASWLLPMLLLAPAVRAKQDCTCSCGLWLWQDIYYFFGLSGPEIRNSQVKDLVFTRDVDCAKTYYQAHSAFHFHKCMCPAAIMHKAIICLLGLDVEDNAVATKADNFSRAAPKTYVSRVAMLFEGALRASFSHDCPYWPVSRAELVVNYFRFAAEAFEGRGAISSPVSWLRRNRAETWWLSRQRLLALQSPVPELPELPRRFVRRAEAMVRARAPEVHCAIPVVLPAEVEQMVAVAATWGRECTSLTFYAANGEAEVLSDLPAAVRRSGVAADAEAAARAAAAARTAEGLEAAVVVNLLKDPLYTSWLLPDPAPGEGTYSVKRGNLIQKVFAMVDHAARSRPAAGGLFCRMVLDSILLVSRLRRFSVLAGIDANRSRVVLGHPNHMEKLNLGLVFPDGGAPICMPWQVLQDLAVHTRKVWRPVFPARSARKACVNAEGITDDLTLGFCFRELGVSLHPAVIDEHGRTRFSRGRLPQDLPPDAVDRIVWGHLGRLHHLAMCTPECDAVHPDAWVDEHQLISVHGYKSPADIRRVYEHFLST
eukprot:TRINITY_DN40835_c0_g1_i1.p1 TRINITY_DN40835_c0_g1~~TRINITY_DN40835_c0_g1_i1.p1  ORF type:complete len:560 (+),score=76.44 TRINITY_DN40835_c0_g1_i1:48-1727(+)